MPTRQWRSHETEGDVDVSKVVAVVQKNANLARRTVVETARLIAQSSPISAKGCMAHSIMTAKDRISADARRRLDLLIRDQLG